MRKEKNAGNIVIFLSPPTIEVQCEGPSDIVMKDPVVGGILVDDTVALL